MDCEATLIHLMDIRDRGTTSEVIMDTLRKVINSYEEKEKGVLTDLVKQAQVDIIDQIWEDPHDVYLCQRYSELKSIAETLNIKIDAI